MKRVFQILSVLIIFLVISCGDDDAVNNDNNGNNNGNNNINFYNSDEPLKSPNDFCSMRVGTQWEYTYVVDTIPWENYILIIQSVDIIGADSIFNQYTFKDGNYLNGPKNFAKKSEGFYFKEGHEDTLQLLYKYPAILNDIYNNYTSNYYSHKVTIKSTDTLINVPFGNLKCIHYLTEYFYPSGDIYQYNYFVSKRIGLISTIMYHYVARENKKYFIYESNLVNYKY